MQNLIIIPTIAASAAFAYALEHFTASPWAKAHEKTSTALYLASLVLSLVAIHLVVHMPSDYLLGIMGFWIGIRLAELKKSRKAKKEWLVALTDSLKKSLDERVTPDAVVEIDITDCSEAALNAKIAELTKAGYTVITSRHHNNNKRTLSVSGDAAAVAGS